MAITKQDLRQIEAKTQDFEQLGLASGATLSQIVDEINTDLDFPLKLTATFPAADSKLNFSNSMLTAPDGVNKIVPPVKKQIFPSLTSLYIDFQTQLTSPSGFDIVWPSTNTVGKVRYICFTLISSGNIKALFSDEYVTEAALTNPTTGFNPGGLFISGGLPVGYLIIECTNALGYYKTSGSAANIIENAKIFRFGSGAGGGGGAGDANSFTENLKHRLVNSFYEYVTPVIFETDEKTLTDLTLGVTTADFDIVDGIYRFDAAGEQFVSVSMLCDEFLALDDDSRKIELHAEWFDSLTRDDTATYYASLDGTSYEAITMTQQGASNKFTGDISLAVPSSVLQFPAALIADTQTTILNSTTLQSIATKFTVSANKVAINRLNLDIVKTGSPSGSYIISIVEDNAGSPTGTIIYSTIALISSLSAGTNSLILNNFRNVLPKLSTPKSYWVKIETDAAYKASYSVGTSVGVRSAATSGGSDKVYNAGSWTAAPTIQTKYSILGHKYDLRVKVVSSAGGKKLKSYGIFYNEKVASVITGNQALQKFTFSGDTNVYQFAVTAFLPNPDALKVYDIKTGQVYRYPAFSLHGQTVEFNDGAFFVPGETVELLFDQSEGGGFDNSDANASLLAANHLGSTDGTIDKSANGRGIYLRRPDGTLREICIDNSDNIVIYSIP